MAEEENICINYKDCLNYDPAKCKESDKRDCYQKEPIMSGTLEDFANHIKEMRKINPMYGLFRIQPETSDKFDPELAYKLSLLVHNECNDAHHDIGVRLAQIANKFYKEKLLSLVDAIMSEYISTQTTESFSIFLINKITLFRI